MTSREGKNILKPPLIFGNDAQIRAVRFLEEVEEAKTSIHSCKHLSAHIKTLKSDGKVAAACETFECGCGHKDEHGEYKEDAVWAALRALASEAWW